MTRPQSPILLANPLWPTRLKLTRAPWNRSLSTRTFRPRCFKTRSGLTTRLTIPQVKISHHPKIWWWSNKSLMTQMKSSKWWQSHLSSKRSNFRRPQVRPSLRKLRALSRGSGRVPNLSGNRLRVESPKRAFWSPGHPWPIGSLENGSERNFPKKKKTFSPKRFTSKASRRTPYQNQFKKFKNKTAQKFYNP